MNQPAPINQEAANQLNPIIRRALSEIARHINRGEWLLLTHDGDVYTCEKMPVKDSEGMYVEPSAHYLLSIQGEVPTVYPETIWKV